MRQLLLIFCLFRKPISLQFLLSLISTLEPQELESNEGFVRHAVDQLAGIGIVQQISEQYSLHSLVQQYYYNSLCSFPDVMKRIHKSIAAEYKKSCWRQRSRGLDTNGLLDAIEAVYHYCQSGDYNYAAHWYHNDLQLRHDHLTLELGAYQTALSILKLFFPENDISKEILVSDLDLASYLFNDIGLV